MWTTSHRGIYDRSGLRYPSDPSDAEWEIVAPMIPPAKRGGRPRTVNIREVLNGISYVLSTGCQWRAVPKDLPPPRHHPPRAAQSRKTDKIMTNFSHGLLSVCENS